MTSQKNQLPVRFVGYLTAALMLLFYWEAVVQILVEVDVAHRREERAQTERLIADVCRRADATQQAPASP